MSGAVSEDEGDRIADAEFRGEARDVMTSLEFQLHEVRSGRQGGEDVIRMVRREVSNIKLQARASSDPALRTLIHRLDDYASGLQSIGAQQLDDLQVFVDRISKILDGETIAVENVSEIVRQLPARKTFDVGEITISNIEILLVMQPRSAARAVERELLACGYRVTLSTEPYEAFELAVRTKPDMIMTGMVMGELTGVDLACALSSMPKTAHIPLAVITSLAPNHGDLKYLPLKVGIIRRGGHFGDDLANVLQRFEIT